MGLTRTSVRRDTVPFSLSMVADSDGLAATTSGDEAAAAPGEARLLQESLPGMPHPYMNPEAVIGQSGIRRMAWLRDELERLDVYDVPSLRDAYERELAWLEASPALRLRALP